MQKARRMLGRMMLVLAIMAMCIPVYAAKARAASFNYTYNEVHFLAKAKETYKVNLYTALEYEMASGGFSRCTVSSSNTKILAVKKINDTTCKFTWKKAGKVTITYKFYYEGSKKPDEIITVKCKVVENPVTSLKVGGKEYVSKLFIRGSEDSSYTTDQFISGKKGKVKLKLKKGWSVKSATVIPASGKQKKITKVNGTSLKKGDRLYITVKKGSASLQLSYTVS